MKLQPYRSTIYHLSLMQMYCEDKAVHGARRFLSGTRHYMAIPLCQGTDLPVIAECFTCNTLTERTVITFTQGKFKRRTICAFAPKWNFFVTLTINIVWMVSQRSQKATFVSPSNIERLRCYYLQKNTSRYRLNK